MHHKRKRTKNSRAGCLLCKPNKVNGAKHALGLGHAGFGKLRAEVHARDDLRSGGLITASDPPVAELLCASAHDQL